MNTIYAMTLPELVLTDGVSKTSWLHDIPLDESELHASALVASGDYFATLGTTLEDIADALPNMSAEQYRLQNLVGQLLYLQRYYKVVKR